MISNPTPFYLLLTLARLPARPPAPTVSLQMSISTVSSCGGGYSQGYQTSASSYQSASSNSVSASAGFLGISFSNSESWSSSVNSTYSSSQAFTTLQANCVVGTATYDTGLTSSSSNTNLLNSDFVTAISTLLVLQGDTTYVPPTTTTTSCPTAYFNASLSVSSLFASGYNNCWSCSTNENQCQMTCTCAPVKGGGITSTLSLHNCLGGDLYNINGYM